MTRLGSLANQVFSNVELVAYVLLGIMLAFAALLGMGGAAVYLWTAILAQGEAESLLVSISCLCS
jgi:hypothetical protein